MGLNNGGCIYTSSGRTMLIILKISNLDFVSDFYVNSKVIVYRINFFNLGALTFTNNNSLVNRSSKIPGT